MSEQQAEQISEPRPHLRAVDFFCGAGGMTHGLIRAGVQVLGGVDNSVDCRLTYEANNAPARFIQHDIAELDAGELAGMLGFVAEDPDMLFVGCSPCQYWSKIRTERRKSEKSAFLLKEFERFVGALLPGFIVLENVPGLLTNAMSYLPKFLKFLRAKGYVYDQKVIDASHYGVPQHRLRYLMIASRLHQQVQLPEPGEQRITVRQVLGRANGFPPIPAGHVDETEFLHTAAGLSTENLLRIQVTPPDGGNRYSWKDDPALQIPAYRGKDGSFRDVYGRMFWDRPAPTITTRFNSLSNGRFGHPEEHRAISLREGAALQTFPIDYHFHSTSRHGVARQIGNAVPPRLSECIGMHLIRMAQHGNI